MHRIDLRDFLGIMKIMVKQEAIQNIVKRIAENYKPEKIYLFGSFVWGKPTNDSDVDLFIIKDTEQNHLDRDKAVRRIINRELPVDLLIYTPQETQRRLGIGDFFIRNILQKGKVLYESN